jgi:hypothetical protein
MGEKNYVLVFGLAKEVYIIFLGIENIYGYITSLYIYKQKIRVLGYHSKKLGQLQIRF